MNRWLIFSSCVFFGLATHSASAASLTWFGDNVNNVWDLETSANWLNGTTPSVFTNGDTVTFDDSGSNSPVINITGTISPGNPITVNSSLNYTFGGTGSLAGNMGIVKSGTGTLTINTVNSYLGTHTVNGGTLSIVGGGQVYSDASREIANAFVVNSAGTLEFDNWAISSGSFGTLWFSTANIVVNGGKLRYVGTGATSEERAFTIGTGGATMESVNSGAKWTISYLHSWYSSLGSSAASGDMLTLTGDGDGQIDQRIPGLQGLTKNGSGTWRLTFQNTYTGPTVVNAGTLILNSDTGNTQYGVLRGSSGLTVNSGATVLLAGNNAISGWGGTAKPIIVNGGTLNAQGGNHTIGELTLNGGEVTSANPPSTWGCLNFKGDVAVTDNSTISAINANVSKTNLTFTVSDGKTLTVSGSFKHDVADAIIKAGPGTMNFTGANTSSVAGPLTVNGGTLAFGTSYPFTSTPDISLASGTKLDITAAGFTLGSTAAQKLVGTGQVQGALSLGYYGTIAPAGDATAGTLTVNGNLDTYASGIIKFDLANVTTPANNDYLNLTGTGNLSLYSTTISINMLNSALINGTYKLIGYTGTLSGGANYCTLAGVVPGTSRQSFTLSDATPNEIDLIVSGAPPKTLTWVGGVNYDWDLATTVNWKDAASAPEKFYDGDSVLFDDTGNHALPVQLTTTLQPLAVTINGTADYTFAGYGKIGGSASLTKNSTGTLYLVNTGVNDYTGTTTNAAGTIQIGDGTTWGAGALGTGPVVNNGALVFNRPDDYEVVVAISGDGTLGQKGPGTLTLSGVNTYKGTTTVSGGTVKLNNATALGDAAGAVNITAVAGVGGAIDLNGFTLRDKAVSVQGNGPDGNGAINNSSFTTTASAAFNNLTLTDDTTIAATGYRWDINDGAFNANGHDLTKNGTADIWIGEVGETNLGAIHATAGWFGVNGNVSLGDPTKPVTVESGATFGLWATGSHVINKPVVLKDTAALYSDGGNNTISGAVTLDGTGTIEVGSTQLTLSGNIGGAGLLQKIWGGTIVLTGTANNWQGGTNIGTPDNTWGGIVQIGDGGANGSFPDVPGTTATIEANSTLSFNSSSSFTIVNSTIAGAGTLNKTGSGTLALNGANTYFTGPTTVKGGVLQVGNSSALGTGTVTVAGNTATPRVELLGDTGGLTMANAFVLAGRQPAIADAALLNVSGNNSIIGDVSFTTGGTEYNIQSDADKLTLNTVTDNTGTSGDTRNLNLKGAGNGEVTGGIANGTSTNTINVVKDGVGTWTLSSWGNYYTGSTTVKAGTLALGAYSSIASSSVVNVYSGAVLDASAITGGFNVAGTQILTGSGTVNGSVTDSFGATFLAGGSFATGNLAVTNNLTMNGGANVLVNFGPAGAHNQINVGGDVTLSGVTNLVPVPLAGTPVGPYTAIQATGAFTGIDTNLAIINTTRYTFSATADTVGKKVVLALTGGAAKTLTWVGDGSANNWDLMTSVNWKDPAANPEQFYNADNVVFDDTTTNNTVNLVNDTTLKGLIPGSVTITGTRDYVLGGTGRILGTTSLTKSGIGTLIINTSNEYLGDTTVNGGVLKFGSAAAVASLPGAIVVNGGSLDINNVNFGTKEIRIQGAGYNGNGAIISTVQPSYPYNPLVNNLTFTGDATIGGNPTTVNWNRWDIHQGTIHGNNFAMTKVGTGAEMYWNSCGDTGLGDINVNAGTFGVIDNTTLGDKTKTLTVNSGGTFSLWSSTPGTAKKFLALNGGSTFMSGGNANTFDGDGTLTGASTFLTYSNLTLTGDLGGTGGFEKRGAATLKLVGDESCQGNISILDGELQLSGNSNVGNIDVSESKKLTILDGTLVAADITGAGAVHVAGTSILEATSITADSLTIGFAPQAELSAVPEPSTLTLLAFVGLGLIVLGVHRKR